MPSLNPDGHQLVTDWHNKTQGTPFEGGQMPWSYHKYVGHDINRDMFMLNMTESRTLARFLSREWHPQVFLAMHQMGTNGPRFFVPLVHRHEPGSRSSPRRLLDSAMARLESQETGRLNDIDYTGRVMRFRPRRNTVCSDEVASARLASPVVARDLRGATRGLRGTPQINQPGPAPGAPTSSIQLATHGLQAASRPRQLVSNFVTMGRR
jgi:hypothetical protein